jgi:hypothetical protein
MVFGRSNREACFLAFLLASLTQVSCVEEVIIGEVTRNGIDLVVIEQNSGATSSFVYVFNVRKGHQSRRVGYITEVSGDQPAMYWQSDRAFKIEFQHAKRCWFVDKNIQLDRQILSFAIAGECNENNMIT